MQTIQKHGPSSDDNPRRGGQATIGLFGVLGGNHLRASQATPDQQRQASPRHDDRVKVIDGLTFGQRRARIRALVSKPPPRTSVPPVVRLKAGNYAAFVRLSEREQRPVTEVMEEWLSDCEQLIGRDEFFEGSSHAMTPAMRRAARASDERERRPSRADEHADYIHRCTETGYVEIALATDG